MNHPVRQPLWPGHQTVAALWIDATLLSMPQRRALLIANWQPGSRALQFDGGDLLLFAQSERRYCGDGRGLPLVRVDGVLLSAPLRPDERATLAGADIGVIVGAQVCALRLADATAIDLSLDVDLSGHALHEIFDLRTAVVAPPPLAPRELSDILGDRMPTPSPAARRFLDRLQRRADAATKPQRPSEPSTLRRFWHTLLYLGKPGAGTAGSLAVRQAPAVPPAWRTWAARIAQWSGVAAVLGLRQDLYLKRLFGMLQRNDLDEALRHALPLGGDTAGSAGQAFGVPGRRSTLDLKGTGGGALGIGLSATALTRLRALYRQAFERLDRAGRVDEAVFVLARLLEARQEALDYLLRHGRGVQAAELALAWDMPPATIVRLLLLAGDTHRALQVARRDDAFAAAVPLLQDSHPDLAAQLREDWGRSLVARGEWLAAVDAVWPLLQYRDRAIDWLRTAEASGNELGARALVYRAVLLPNSLDEIAGRLDALAAPEAAADSRCALARQLLATSVQNPALDSMTALLLPSIAADRALNRNDLSGRDLDLLTNRAGDALWNADKPKWVLPTRAAARRLLDGSTPLRPTLPAAGLMRVYDAGVIAPGCYLVALGEIGAAVVDTAGVVQQRYAVPAHDLVIADNGRVALAIARREDVLRISRLDLITHRVSDLGSLPLQRFSRRFDGLAWSVCGPRHLQQLDASGPLDVLWQVELPGPIGMVTFDGDAESCLTQTLQGFEHWTYTRTARRLRWRAPVTPNPTYHTLLHGEVLAQASPRVNGTRTHELHVEIVHGRGRGLDVAMALPELAGASGWSATLLADAVLVSVDIDHRRCFRLFQLSRKQCVLELDSTDKTTNAVQRGDDLLFVDAHGRVLHVDLATSRAQGFSLI
jgi:hypothetical protein